LAIPAHYPESIRRVLLSLLEDLAPCAPEPFAVAVYGSLARGTFRDGESDVNLAVVLTEASARVLDSLREPLRKAWRAARVEPLILTQKELPRIADAFPIKLFDIKQHHDLILGTEPFTEFEVKWLAVRVRAEQELRNHLLRLRRSWLLDGGDVRALAPVLFRSASSLLFELEALLWLKGEELRGLSQDQVFMRAGRVFDLDGGVLEQLVAFRRGTGAVDVQSLFADLLGLLARCVEIADRLEASG
jgi:predicted nucleotidyltransferase